MKKIISVCLATLFCLTALAGLGGCKKNEGNNSGNNSNNGVSVAESYDYTTGIDYNGTPLTLAASGASSYGIVIPAEANETIVGIAEELNNYIYSVSGASLLTYKDTEALPDKIISLGNTTLFSQTGLNVSALSYDGFYIKTVGDDIFISANMERGVMYGVYSFIERFLGVRWLNDTYTHIPTSSTIEVYPCDIKEEPNFEMRNWLGGATYLGSDTYKNHMRFYLAENEFCKEVWTVHNSTDNEVQPGIGYVNKSDVVAPDAPKGERTLGEVHPEYFSDYTNSIASNYDLCYTSGIDENGNLIAQEAESVTNYIIDKIKKFLTNDAEKREINYFMIGQVDNRDARCMCSVCKDRREKYLDSGIYVIFMNCIEKHVNEWLQQEQGRKVDFIMFAYHQTSAPPTKEVNGTYEPLSPLCVANDHLYIRLAMRYVDFAYSMVDEKQVASEQASVVGWQRVAKNFMVWDYTANYLEYFYYYPAMHYLKENLVFYKSLGTTYVTNQSSYSQNGIWFDDLMCYVSSRLYWNFDWDVNYLINEYLTLLYGEGAPYVKQIIEIFDGHYAALRNEDKLSMFINVESSPHLSAENHPIELLDRIIYILDEGKESINGNPNISSSEKGRISTLFDFIRLTPMQMTLRNYTAYYTEETKLDYAREFFALCDKLGIKQLGEHSNRSVEARRAEYGL